MSLEQEDSQGGIGIPQKRRITEEKDVWVNWSPKERIQQLAKDARQTA
jgi:hypothetical protein